MSDTLFSREVASRGGHPPDVWVGGFHTIRSRVLGPVDAGHFGRTLREGVIHPMIRVAHASMVRNMDLFADKYVHVQRLPFRKEAPGRPKDATKVTTLLVWE